MGKKARLAPGPSAVAQAGARLALTCSAGARPRARARRRRSGIDAFQRTLAVRRIIDSQRRAASTLRYGAAARAAWNVLAEAGRLAYLERVQSRKRRAGLLRLVLSQWQRRSDEERDDEARREGTQPMGSRPRAVGLPRAVRAAGDTAAAEHSPPDPPQRLTRDGDVASRGGGARQRLVVVRRALNSLTQRGKATRCARGGSAAATSGGCGRHLCVDLMRYAKRRCGPARARYRRAVGASHDACRHEPRPARLV